MEYVKPTLYIDIDKKNKHGFKNLVHKIIDCWEYVRQS